MNGFVLSANVICDSDKKITTDLYGFVLLEFDMAFKTEPKLSGIYGYSLHCLQPNIYSFPSTVHVTYCRQIGNEPTTHLLEDFCQLSFPFRTLAVRSACLLVSGRTHTLCRREINLRLMLYYNSSVISPVLL